MTIETEYSCDPQTADMIVELLAGAATSLGTPATVMVPASALIKLGIRLSIGGVSIPDNAALSAVQDEMRTRGELPEIG